MHYLDTNIIVYSVVNQDPGKMEVSQSIIRDLFENDNLLISPLNLQELIYTLSKLKIDIKHIEQTYLCIGREADLIFTELKFKKGPQTA